jgi:hypothetical protein
MMGAAWYVSGIERINVRGRDRNRVQQREDEMDVNL